MDFFFVIWYWPFLIKHNILTSYFFTMKLLLKSLLIFSVDNVIIISKKKEDCHIEGHHKCQYSGKEGWMDGLLRWFSQAFKKKDVELKLSLQWSLVFKKLWKTLILTFEEWSSLWWILRITQNRGWVSAMMIKKQAQNEGYFKNNFIMFSTFLKWLDIQIEWTCFNFPIMLHDEVMNLSVFSNSFQIPMNVLTCKWFTNLTLKYLTTCRVFLSLLYLVLLFCLHPLVIF